MMKLAIAITVTILAIFCTMRKHSSAISVISHVDSYIILAIPLRHRYDDLKVIETLFIYFINFNN
jgi:hypothetical protein